MNNCIFAIFLATIVLSGCTSAESDKDFSEQEQYLIYKNDSAFKSYLFGVKCFNDTLRKLSKVDCEKASIDIDLYKVSLESKFIRFRDFYDEFRNKMEEEIEWGYVFDSMDIWFPVDNIEHSYKLCKEIVDNDENSKEYYFHCMDFWIKRFTPECSTADEDSMQFYINKMRAARDERMEGVDSVARKKIYLYYMNKQHEWQKEWCDMNGREQGMLPLLVY